MTYENFRKQYALTLNEAQERAVRTVDGHVLLLAVPGSGKTTTLVARLGYMVCACAIVPESILTMTYTVAATQDMRQRFALRFGEELAARMEFRTINGVSARVIRYYEQVMGRRAFALVSDERRLTALVAEIAVGVNREYPTDSEIKGIRSAITYAKNQMLSEEEIRGLDQEIDNFSKIYHAYNRALREQGSMDYDDQMVYARTILLKYPQILGAFQEKFRYICVDEAQDTSKIQHEIIDLLARGNGNLFMVGDEDQSIYGFRAAYPQALLNFEKKYPDATVLLMEQNYRSTRQIVTAANRTIRENKNRYEKTMTSVRGDGAPVHEISLQQRKNQYSYLLKLARGCTRETAVLYRDNDCAMPLIDLLERNGVPYRCRQMDTGFFTNRTVRDITDVIRLGLDGQDNETFLRVYYKFNAGITKNAAERAVRRRDPLTLMERLSEDDTLSEWSRRKCKALQTHLSALVDEPADRAVYRIVNFMGYGEYLQQRGIDLNRAHILEALGAQEPTPARLLERLEELRQIIEEPARNSQSQFILSTIHSSKGLEYEQVYLMDVIDAILPKQGEDVDEEEERRLFYVGMTRAKDELSIFTFQRPGYASAFSASLFPKKTASAEKRTPPRGPTIDRGITTAPAAVDTSQYVVGCHVMHRHFGAGVIVARQGDTATIHFDAIGPKRLSLPIAASGQNPALTLSMMR